MYGDMTKTSQLARNVNKPSGVNAARPSDRNKGLAIVTTRAIRWERVHQLSSRPVSLIFRSNFTSQYLSK